jgi:hypothetical protein
LFGLNQHGGFDAPADNIGKAGAGTLIGRTMDGHREFMAQIKSDPRYLASPDYHFMTTILPADKVLQ